MKEVIISNLPSVKLKLLKNSIWTTLTTKPKSCDVTNTIFIYATKKIHKTGDYIWKIIKYIADLKDNCTLGSYRV